MFEITKRVI